MVNQYYDYQFLSSSLRPTVPNFVNLIKPKKSITSSLLSKNSLNSVNTMIDSALKIIRVYDQAVPIINQTRPLIGNIKTTFKVAKAFKRFSNESSLEKAFDNLPDFQEDIKENKKEEFSSGEPFYPKN